MNLEIGMQTADPLLFAEKVKIKALTPSCEIPSKTREHICLGISPFNSLFSEDYIRDIVAFALRNFRSFHLYLPDEPTFYTLEALGYNPDDCRRKMKKQLNWLRNKIERALVANGLNPEAENYILDSSALSQNSCYQEELKKVFILFDTDEAFRNSCLLASKWVLQGKLNESEISEGQMLTAVKYFLSELPFFASSNKIVGSSTSIFCYHQAIDFHQQLYRHIFKYRPENGQGYGIILMDSAP